MSLESEIIGNELARVIQQIGKLMLNLEFEMTDGHADSTSTDQVTMVNIDVTGEWVGSISLSCSTCFARKIAERIYEGLPAEKIRPMLIDDALRELGNIVGGNVKNFLPQPVALGLPTLGHPTTHAGETTVIVAQQFQSEVGNLYAQVARN